MWCWNLIIIGLLLIIIYLFANLRTIVRIASGFKVLVMKGIALLLVVRFRLFSLFPSLFHMTHTFLRGLIPVLREPCSAGWVMRRRPMPSPR